MAINSGPYDGLTTAEFKQQIAADLAAKGIGRAAVNYKLRDWLFSRQHFWGEPFPILHELDAAGKPTGRIRRSSPRICRWTCRRNDVRRAARRARAAVGQGARTIGSTSRSTARATSARRTPCRNGPARAGIICGSSTRKTTRRWSIRQIEKAWMPVDLYVGGAEHAVLHLLYARFWHKVLFDRGYVSTTEPFQKLVNQGMILGENSEKMSKSRGNVVNPDEVVRGIRGRLPAAVRDVHGPAGGRQAVEHGRRQRRARLSGPRVADDCRRPGGGGHAQRRPWDVEPTAEQNRVLHKTIKAVTADMEQMSFNTAIARMMEFTNFFLKAERAAAGGDGEARVVALAVCAARGRGALAGARPRRRRWPTSPGPTFDEAAIREDTIEVPVQINGKLRGRIQVPTDADKAALEVGRPRRRRNRRTAGRQDGGQDDRRAGADGELCREVDVAGLPANRIGPLSRRERARVRECESFDQMTITHPRFDQKT